ncbi:uncharacterized protein HKW66_Vig0070500 [Vigna angularis]|uniref:25S rRNA (uridine-N(3))-methyltransferase BMT5-like domain-containing protein n=1 Tax=Phaseolus angularis TaxID=3914 RepID=A0A8T0K7L3_PHAAN|nr:uncharacterized protein HKW66_Vig0070500 [Vigna angularis]
MDTRNNNDDNLCTDDCDQESGLKDEESAKAEKWKKHYSSKHKILLVGEGDFSFSLCLARAFGSAHNLVATSLDSHGDIGKKYCNGVSNVLELEERGCCVFHGVDAKEMSNHFFLKTQRLNKRLLKSFLANAKALLKKDDGEIHVTQKEGDPYNKWDLVKKAEKKGLTLLHVEPFLKDEYAGYDNKRAHGKLSDASFPVGEASTYKFKLLTSNTH